MVVEAELKARGDSATVEPQPREEAAAQAHVEPRAFTAEDFSFSGPSSGGGDSASVTTTQTSLFLTALKPGHARRRNPVAPRSCYGEVAPTLEIGSSHVPTTART